MSTRPLDVVNSVAGAKSGSGAKELETDFFEGSRQHINI